MSSYQGLPGGPRDPHPCGCPPAAVITDPARHDAYHQQIGGPAHCLRFCLCGDCPAYPAQQHALAVLREQEWRLRDRIEGERAARHMRGAA